MDIREERRYLLQKQATVDRPLVTGYNRYSKTPNIDFMVVSLSTTIG